MLKRRRKFSRNWAADSAATMATAKRNRFSSAWIRPAALIAGLLAASCSSPRDRPTPGPGGAAGETPAPVQYALSESVGGIRALEFSRDGRWLAVSERNPNQTRVVDLSSGEQAWAARLEKRLRGDYWATGLAGDLEYSPDGSILAVEAIDGSGPGFVFLLDAATGALIHALDGPTDFATSVRFNSNGTRVAALSYEFLESGARSVIWEWDVATGDVFRQIQLPPSETDWAESQAMDYAADGSLYVLGLSPQVYRMMPGAKKAVEVRTQSPAVTLCVSSDRNAIIVQTESPNEGVQAVEYVDAKTGRVVRDETAPNLFESLSARQRNLSFFAIRSADKLKYQVFHADTRVPAFETRDAKDAVQCFAVSPLGNCIAVGRESGVVELYDPKTGQVVVTYAPLPSMSDGTGDEAETPATTDWCAWLPSGAYSGSPGCEKWMIATAGGKKISESELKDLYRDDDAVREAFRKFAPN